VKRIKGIAMKMKIDKNNSVKFLLYIAVIILINLVSTTLFFRIDLTDNDVYSLSKSSEDVVKNLSEPLTVKVFFTSNLPAPSNNIERYLSDLLEEYAVSGNRYFNYQFYNVSTEESEEAKKNQELARGYGVTPVQIQNIERDEVKFQRAYMGMALTYGDIIETRPTITSTEGLEFKITSTIRKMSNKINALMSLKENISIKLFLSSSLKAVGPYINVTGISKLPSELKGIVNKINGKNYGRLSFNYLDPTLNNRDEDEARKNELPSFKWDTFQDRRGQVISGDRGYADILVSHGDKTEKIQLLDVVRLPIFGTQYQMKDLDEIEALLNGIVENIIDVNEEIGYLADHGTGEVGGIPSHLLGMMDDDESLSNFSKLLSEQYSIKQVNLKETGISGGLPTLIIAGAKESFSDYELYQIDQYLMKGRNLAIFMDPLEEHAPEHNRQTQMMFRQQPPVYTPLNTGLEKLLTHYGFKVGNNYVLDDNCYKQRVPRMMGGGEQPVYFAPIIKNEFINKDADFLNNIKGLVMYKAASVEINEDKVNKNNLDSMKLFSSSEKAWEMKGGFNPMYLNPPQNESEYKQVAMAYVLEGEFPSYFADKPIPERPADYAEEENVDKKDKEGFDTSSVVSDGMTIKKGKPGRVFVVGTSEILKNNILDEEGEDPNTQFVLNVIDYLNDRGDYAVMRSKAQRFNPLKEIRPNTKTVIKTSNIVGLPVLMILAGLVVWIRRKSRKKTIQQIFSKQITSGA
jgi:ABC-type uncharacterized transport system involved in gliding motility auxiliary subunit